MTKARVIGNLQDGMLAWYQSQVKFSDASVERKLDTEPFNYRDTMRVDKKKLATTKRK